MTRNLFYTALGLVGLVWTLAIGVANADTTIIHYTGSNIEYRLNDNTEHFTGVGTITITDGTDTITILDRNLGATRAGIGCDYDNNSGFCVGGELDETYGYHFQRGNNHGFKACSDNIGCTSFPQQETTVTGIKMAWSPEYSNKGFNASDFILDSSSYFWEDNLNHEDLRGGSGDQKDVGYGFGINNKNRKGPCPENFHVPSWGEWNQVLNMLPGVNDLEKRNQLHNNLLIPFAGYRLHDASCLELGRGIYFWTSSPYSNKNSRNFFAGLSSNNICTGCNGHYTLAFSIRCFYNKYEKYSQSFNIAFLNDGKNIWNGEVVSGDKIPEEIINTYLTGLTKTGYNFSGWVISGSDEMFDVENDVVTTGITLNAVWELNKYIITYELDGGVNNENNVTGYTIEDAVTFESPTRDGYKFDGWFIDAQFITGITTIPPGTTGDITLYAKWTKIEIKPSGGYSGGGGRSNKTSDTQDSDSSQNDKKTENVIQSETKGSEESSNIPMDSLEKSSEGQTYTQEFQEAYEFAKEKGITTMPTINDANMNGKLTRIAMAKMLSYYAINVLGQKPDETRNNKFNDITDKLDAQYDSGVTLAYQLGIMGINMPDNMFRPNDEVTRAEFATALSRMLYSTPDGKPYYATHLQKLKAEGILKNDDYKMKELRGYVMIMLKRSAK